MTKTAARSPSPGVSFAGRGEPGWTMQVRMVSASAHSLTAGNVLPWSGPTDMSRSNSTRLPFTATMRYLPSAITSSPLRARTVFPFNTMRRSLNAAAGMTSPFISIPTTCQVPSAFLYSGAATTALARRMAIR